MAYLLDPQYFGIEMSQDLDGRKDFQLLHQTVASINKLSKLLNPNDERADIHQSGEFINFTDTIRKYPEVFACVKNQSISVLTWWKAYEEQFPYLSKVATRVFSCVCSSAASERNFSSFAFVQNTLRNCLGTRTVEKCVFVYANSKELNKIDPIEEFSVSSCL